MAYARCSFHFRLRGWLYLSEQAWLAAAIHRKRPGNIRQVGADYYSDYDVVSLAVTMLTQPESNDVLVRFYRKVRPDVRGWRAVALLAPEVPPTRDLGRNLMAWVLGCGMVYLALFGMGKVLFHQMGVGLTLLIGSVVCAWLLYAEQSSRGWGAEKTEELPQAVLRH